MITQADLLNVASETNELIAKHRVFASATFQCMDDKDIVVNFTHHDDRYPQGNRSIYLYTFNTEHKLRAFNYQLDKVLEGGLLDEYL